MPGIETETTHVALARYYRGNYEPLTFADIDNPVMFILALLQTIICRLVYADLSFVTVTFNVDDI